MDSQIFQYFGLKKEFTQPNNIQKKQKKQLVNNFKYAIKSMYLVKFCIQDIAM